MATSTLPQPRAPPHSSLASALLTHHPQTYTFTFTPFLQRTYQHSLPDRPICKPYQTGSCPLKTQCPDRHTTLTAANPVLLHRRPRARRRRLRLPRLQALAAGLCKKGTSCEFLHEYNLRKMPECNFFVRNGYCSNGDECLYLHIDPSSRLPLSALRKGFLSAGAEV
ncbi:RNA-binding component of cleavage and polyadenylation factor [Collariella sp. IMI 366227]|nr:RNA-binding component of cleavage and polyadenylation factor [Collariella sp. IMI 366227]